MSSFIKHIELAGRKHGRVKAFNDFLTFAVCALSMGTQEDLYLETAQKYQTDEMISFSHAFASLVDEMDNKGEGLKDCLGDYFMEIQGSGWHGQFFTPQPICDMMAMLGTNTDNNTDKKQKEIFIGKTINDCCCGSGRMLLASAKINRKSIFSGSDIDYQCCQMTLINLCLNGLTGHVSHMDTLSLEEWKRWSVGIHPIHLVPYIQKLEFTKKEKIINQTMLDFYELEEKQETKPLIQVMQTEQNEYSNLFNEIDLLL